MITQEHYQQLVKAYKKAEDLEKEWVEKFVSHQIIFPSDKPTVMPSDLFNFKSLQDDRSKKLKDLLNWRNF